MKYLGDITKIDGRTVPRVDIIVGGSPCQDLSVAGKRAGLAGQRSGLFMEQIRIVKQMREEQIRNGVPADNIRPRYLVWENVPGALSSNNGWDFRCVLEEVCRIADHSVSIPRPAEGKWTNAGEIVADEWSVAWRIHDAQYWGKTVIDRDTGAILQMGTPQRRRRIALVADFRGREVGGGCLFEKVSVFGEGVPRYSTQGEEPNERFPEDAERSTDPSIVETQPICIEMTSTKNTVIADGIMPTLTARMGTGGNQVNAVCAGFYPQMKAEGQSYTEELSPTLVVGTSPGYQNGVCINQVVRRITPKEAERLQGYPDGWTDIGEWIDSKGKKHASSDANRYKALGNSIALPFWQWLAKRIRDFYPQDYTPTMASLFDGIAGFPLVFSRAGVKPVWSSEIEEFCIAVAKKHFPDEEEEQCRTG